MRKRLRFLVLALLLMVSICSVETVSVEAAKKKVTATISSTKVKVGKTVQISTKLKGVTFSTSNAKVAYVDVDGTVTGKKTGTATISVMKKGYTAKKFRITVVKNKKLPTVRVACDEIAIAEQVTEEGFSVAVKNKGQYKANKVVLLYSIKTISGTMNKTLTVENIGKAKEKLVSDATLNTTNVLSFKLKKISVYAGDGLMAHNFISDKYSYTYGTEDTKAPIFSGWVEKNSFKNGQVFMTVYAGEYFDYTKYVFAEDDRDSKVTVEVDTSKVNWKKQGVNKVYFTATDKAGNTATTYAKIYVRIPSSEIDDMAKQVLDEIIEDSWSDQKKAQAIYKYIRTHFSYIGHSDKSSWEKAAKYGLMYDTGDCFNYYAAARILLTRAGIPNIMIRKVAGYPTNHWWNLAYVKGGWYHYDTCPRKNQAVFCLLTDAQMLSYSRKNNNCNDFNGKLYPERSKKEISQLIYGRRY